MRARVRRRTSAALRVHGANQDGRPAGHCGDQLPRPGRPLGRRGHRAAAVHAVRGHGVRGQRERLEHGPRARLRRDGSQPQGPTCRRFVITILYYNGCAQRADTLISGVPGVGWRTGGFRTRETPARAFSCSISWTAENAFHVSVRGGGLETIKTDYCSIKTRQPISRLCVSQTSLRVQARYDTRLNHQPTIICSCSEKSSKVTEKQWCCDLLE